MSKRKLTAVALPSLPQGIYHDTVIPNLVYHVGKTRRTWRLRGRGPGGQYQRTLGFWLGSNPPPGSGHLGLSEARELARQQLERVAVGAAIAVPVAHPKTALTVADMLDRYEAHRRKVGGRIKNLTHAMATVRRGLADYAALPAAAFSKADLRAARDKIAANAPVMANRFQAYTGPILRWADSEDFIPRDFSRAVIRVGREEKRERTLAPAELAAIWQAAGAMTGVAASYGRLVRFLAVTACRKGEAVALKHGDIINGSWRQADNKSSRPHLVALPGVARELVGSGEARALVFPGERGPLSGFSKFKVALDAASGVENWRLHDLRRTAASGMQELGVTHDVVAAVLNHSISGVTGVYLRGSMEQAKAEALAKWADKVISIVNGKYKLFV